MSQVSFLKFSVLAAACFVLAACSDTDWEHAMSYLPVERGPNIPAQSASVSPPDAAPEPTPIPQPQPVLAQPVPLQPAAATVAVTSTQEPLVNKHCRTVATQRALDGQYMGMDDEAQRQEYERTYADCAAWDAAHHS